MVKPAMKLHIGSASHPGLHRTVNEDRILIDEAHGIFLVVDGLGGHAAGETAAEIAIQTIRESLRYSDALASEKQIREAITEANNQIFKRAQSREEWSGMACVLTLAIVQDEWVDVGHVGDSRLYLISDGVLRKITSDHSPVGELEESGELTETEAMRHPRRHEVFRDVGSEPRDPDDTQFTETKRIAFPPDAALLLCTDGLTDAITSAAINGIIRSDGKSPDEIAQKLVEAANASGGKDNISVIFVAGPEFRTSGPSTPDAADRHSITRMRVEQSRWSILWQRLPWLLIGMVLGFLTWIVSGNFVPQGVKQVRSVENRRSPVHIAANPLNARSVANALAGALPGDMIDVPPGEYLGPLALKNGVSIVGSLPRRPTIRSGGASSDHLGVALTASGVHGAQIENLEIISDETHPLQIGIALADSAVKIVNNKVSGAIEAGIRIEGKSEADLIANDLSGNSGAGLQAKDQSLVRLTGNWITNNGLVPGTPRAGLEVSPTAKLEATHNVFTHNGLSETDGLPPGEADQLRKNNILELRGSKMKVTPTADK
ncbi:MAG: protein phosphatase 2C domain-containing protein [Acidobacteriaceae bacterium]|nr:protein phosphatase 2C domain-containing protein [Acidobacteriaceae bacterium]